VTGAPVDGTAAISVANAGKRYVKYDDEAMLATRRARLWSRTTRGDHWALRGLDLEVAPGECLGLIGRNGSGKSTLLRMIAGVTAPTEGSVTVRGRIAPLIAVGVGFHPELTGRENVYVNGSILGLSRRSLDARFDEIVEFAEIEKFIDTPVKFYSSGMFVRLGFGVSMFAEPDVLLVDEVLAVGDLGFQLKCFDQMERARESGTSIVVVSHNLNAIRRLCPTTLLLERGVEVYSGDTSEAISRYHEVLGEAREIEDPTIAGRPSHHAEGITPMVEVVAVELLGPDGKQTRNVSSSDEVTFAMDAKILETIVDPIIGFHIYNSAGMEVYGDSTYGTATGCFAAGSSARFTMTLPARLATGSFTVSFNVLTHEGVGAMWPHRPLAFFVSGRPTAWGAADLNGRIDVVHRGDEA